MVTFPHDLILPQLATEELIIELHLSLDWVVCLKHSILTHETVVFQGQRESMSQNTVLLHGLYGRLSHAKVKNIRFNYFSATKT